MLSVARILSPEKRHSAAPYRETPAICREPQRQTQVCQAVLHRSVRPATSSMSLALGIDDALELAQHVHAGKELRQASVGFALFPNGRDELAVLQLDAVHRHV